MDPKEEAKKKLSELLMREEQENPLSDDEARQLLRSCFAHFISDAEELETHVEDLIAKRKEAEEQRDPEDAALKEYALSRIRHFIGLFIFYDRKEDTQLSNEQLDAIIKRGVITLDEMVETFRFELEKAVTSIKEH